MKDSRKKVLPRKEAAFQVIRRYEPIEFDELMIKLSPVFSAWRESKNTECKKQSYNSRPRKGSKHE